MTTELLAFCVLVAGNCQIQGKERVRGIRRKSSTPAAAVATAEAEAKAEEAKAEEAAAAAAAFRHDGCTRACHNSEGEMRDADKRSGVARNRRNAACAAIRPANTTAYFAHVHVS